jgi:membrane-bound lytic murein transglycosylase D
MRLIISNLFFLLIFSISSEKGYAQQQAQQISAKAVSDSLPFVEGDDPIVAMMDSLLASEFFSFYCFSDDTGLLNVNEFESGMVPSYTDDVYSQRMRLLDAETPMELVYNSTVKGFIDLYAVRKRALTSRVLGLSQMYFPLFEEALQKYNIPLEMKYLAVVESALNPTAKSRVGAAGLWQFMYTTGKMYGLEVDSYIDERFDPYMATEAACRYLNFLYGLYNDWNLALAAYNSGPGNVNKAIRRSGGKKTFWEIKEFLPQETQGYVPAFIAVNYVMNYAAEHNIYPVKPSFSYFECDTIQVSKKLHLSQIAHFTGVTESQLAELNPMFTKGIIPGNGRYSLRLPVESIGLFLANEESLYSFAASSPAPAEEVVAVAAPAPAPDYVTYKVRGGDVLGKIATRHGVTVNQIMKWNKLKSTRIHPGQKLKIYKNQRS